MSKTVTFTSKKIDTAPLKITVAIPPENPTIKGYFTGQAKIRTQDEIEAFQESVVTDGKSMEEILRWQFEGFDGVGNDAGYCEGEAAFQEILHGVNSAYLPAACAAAYWAQYQEARQGNFNKSRRR